MYTVPVCRNKGTAGRPADDIIMCATNPLTVFVPYMCRRRTGHRWCALPMTGVWCIRRGKIIFARCGPPRNGVKTYTMPPYPVSLLPQGTTALCILLQYSGARGRVDVPAGGRGYNGAKGGNVLNTHCDERARGTGGTRAEKNEKKHTNIIVFATRVVPAEGSCTRVVVVVVVVVVVARVRELCRGSVLFFSPVRRERIRLKRMWVTCRPPGGGIGGTTRRRHGPSKVASRPSTHYTLYT